MVTIRKASREEAASIWDLRNAAIRNRCITHYTREVILKWTEGSAPVDFIDGVETGGYVATFKERMAGFGAINLAHGKIDSLMVHPAVMGNGVGRQLMGYLESLARAYGHARLQLDSSLNAVGFYRACGFDVERTRQHYLLPGVALDCVAMTKDLAGMPFLKGPVAEPAGRNGRHRR